MTDHALDDARASGQRIVLGLTLGLAPLGPGIAWARDLSWLPFLLLAGGVIAAALALSRGQGASSRLGLAAAPVIAVMAITAALAGHPWQLDSHMLYFAVLAVIIVLVDIRAIVAGAALVAVHHVSLSVVLPALIYPAADLLVNVERALMHGVILVIEAAALIYAVWVRQKQTARATADRDRVAASLDAAERAEAEIAKTQALQQAVVTALRGALERLAARDLGGRIDTAFDGEYEGLRRDFNGALDELAETLGGVVALAGDLAAGAEDMSKATQDLARRTESQAATLEQSAAAIEEITVSVKSAAGNADKVRSYVEETREHARSSGDLVGTAVERMSGIERRSGEISKIIGVIDDIAFQTNLLSLNAGVEAARAGEAGKGFAVVATEVRALAQRASTAASDIRDLILGSAGEIDEGVETVNRVGSALSEIIDRVDRISAFVTDIGSAVAEQSNALQEINGAMTDLDRVTQENAATVHHGAAAAQTFRSHASRLKASVERFKLPGVEEADRAPTLCAVRSA